MSLRIRNLKLVPGDSEELLKEKALKVLGKREKDLADFRIVRQSVDARKKQVHLVYSVELTLKDESGISCGDDIEVVAPIQREAEFKASFTDRPVVVGTGPCGLFAALTLARAGAPPLILERGVKVTERARKVETYWKTGILDPDSNVQFGEGGAGTFSDGKLTTRINDPRSRKVLEDFHAFGADDDILYKAKPHIGTDVLRQVIQNIRQYLISLGCEFQFETSLKDLIIENEKIRGIITSREEVISCSHLILAIGHSARDTYEMLLSHGVSMVQKPFSVGVRIEHLQKELDRALYGDFAGHPALGPAEYQLSYRVGDDACYSFCMCPGGIVVASASEPETIVTNGMSFRSRSEENANAALCVNVDGRYFSSDHPLAGVAFQRSLERKAFQMAEGKGAPVQTVGSFLNGGTSIFGKVKPSYTGQVIPCDFRQLFPGPVSEFLETGIRVFDSKIKGFGNLNAVLTGPETRTSAPVRILRDEQFESISVSGLYPAGEGAGYAGGIMSAAVDGIRVAQGILMKEEGRKHE